MGGNGSYTKNTVAFLLQNARTQTLRIVSTGIKY